MNSSITENQISADYAYDAIVVGTGHAGIEAGLALSRLGCKTLMLSVTLDNIGYLACNPSIGGTAKGHLVREVDALGGEMGVAADACTLQLRMLNSSKGPAVHSLRAQVDKYAYHNYMKNVLENAPNLTLRQAEAKNIIVENGKICGVETVLKQCYYAKAVVLACGVYLKSSIIIGDVIEDKGPASFSRANHLSNSLTSLGIELRRFKTGTPARVKLSTINLEKLEAQSGEDTAYSFSALSENVKKKYRDCFLGYTNEGTHDIIKKSLHLSPKYAGLIHGAGARYCPSIEDKIVRFADKTRHQFFLEPEGDDTQEMYVQGISTGLPAPIQLQIYRSISGFENVHIMRDAYAIEYDCINPMELYPSLMHKTYKGLFFAGQINGTSGYEEAAAQGIVSGINAAHFIKDIEPVIFTRDNSYIGVLIDDLVTVGTLEPYRMMTSRAEYRLILRQDNADLRLTQIGYEIGLVDENRYAKFLRKLNEIEKARQMLENLYTPAMVATLFNEVGEAIPCSGIKLKDIIKRSCITEQALITHLSAFDGILPEAVNYIFCEIKYEGYIARANKTADEARRVEHTRLPIDMDYSQIKGLRNEAREKLSALKPLSIGQAGRISGVTPADVNILIFYFCKQNR